MPYTNSAKSLALVFGTICSCVAINYAIAWTEPATTPPGNNVSAPVNIGTAAQSKEGNLSIGSGMKYWITKDGDSFALMNDSSVIRLVMGQDGNVGIGTATPGAKLDVNGQIRISGGNPGAGKVLTSDASGLAAWQAISGALPDGLIGQTLRHNGTSWIANNAIYNDGTNIGIDTATPGAKLDVNGQIKISGGSPGAGKVLTSDAAGLATWQAISGTLPAGANGQTLRHDGTNWIANNIIYNDGTNIGIGTAAPGAKLDVNGQIKISGGSPGAGKVLTSDASGLASWQTNVVLPAGTGGQTLRHNGTNWIANSVVYNDGTNVGIGTATPGTKLEINGQIKITGGNPGAGKVLTSDSSGLASWTSPSGVTTNNGPAAIRKGWGAVAAGNSNISFSINYGIAYDSLPIVLTSKAGTKTTSGVPASLSDCSANYFPYDSGYGAHIRSILTDHMDMTSIPSQLAHLCYTWIAIGPYSGGADLAEYYKTDDRSIEAGDVVAVDKNNDIHVVKSSKAMDYEVMGVVSTDPGQVLGDEYAGAGDKDAVIVALTGRIPVKVSLENGPIKKGDYLTASSVPGVAMKAGKPCVTVGKALEDFDGTGTTELVAPGQAVASESLKLSDKEIAGLEEGRGKVMAFLNIDYWEPEGYEAGQEESIAMLKAADAFQRAADEYQKEKIELMEQRLRNLEIKCQRQ